MSFKTWWWWALIVFAMPCFGQDLTIVRGVVDDVTNVRDYGADGSDQEDDSDAIQAAIDASTGPVYFPQGVYITSKPIKITKAGMTIFGFGDPKNLGKACMILHKANGPLFVLSKDGIQTGLRMSGLWLKGPTSGGNSVGILIETSDKYKPFYTFRHVGINMFGRGIEVKKVGSSNWVGKILIDGCVIHWNGQGIVSTYPAGITNLDVLRSEVRQNKPPEGKACIDVHVNRASIIGCCLEGQARVVHFDRSEMVKISECYFEGNSDFLLSAFRCRGVRFTDNYHRRLQAETYKEPFVLRECSDIIVERPATNPGRWELP